MTGDDAAVPATGLGATDLGRRASPRSGRPTRDASASLGAEILAAGTALFLRDGYAATSMEAIAASARVSKRTLYKRYPDKATMLRAAIAGMVDSWLPGSEAAFADAPLEIALANVARRMLAVALVPEALALHRLMVAEAGRFPEIVRAAHDAGAAIGISRVAELLRTKTTVADPVWAAEQFQTLVVTGPMRRALGFGEPLGAGAQAEWARKCVELFLHGLARPL